MATDEIDDLFGSTGAWALDDDVVHTNHGSFGALTLATQSEVERARRRADGNPMAAWSRDHDAVHARAVAALAELVGARPNDTALATNATVAMDMALQVLPWRPGARILATSTTYPSVAANLRRRAESSGAHVVVLHLDPMSAPEAAGEQVIAALDDVDGVVVDAVASATAAWCDVGTVVDQARSRDVAVVVDGAHEPGQVPLDVAGRDADAWVGNLHKWACAPKSLAAVVVPARHHDRVRAPTATWFDDQPFPANATWQGTGDLGPVWAMDQVVDQARAILARSAAIEALADAGSAHVAAACGGAVLPGAGWMRTIALPVVDDHLGTASATIETALADANVEAKLTTVDRRPLLRLSCHAYSSPRDHDRLAEGVATAIRHLPR